jgi:ComF family protein
MVNLCGSTRCLLCHLPLAINYHGICSYCLKQIPLIPNSCLRCALPTVDCTICSSCRKKNLPWQIMMAVSDYHQPLKQLVHQLKFNARIELAHALARLLLLRWLTFRHQFGIAKPDLVLPVPLFFLRQWQRGFNQAAILAKLLAGWLNCDCPSQYLIRSKATPEQKVLSAAQRRQNLIGTFVCRNMLQQKRVLLVDDVVTTGSTVKEICHTLKRYNAGEIQIICLCRTLSLH